MGLIINQKLRQMFKGYPTVSDKYNVQGGILEEGEIVYGDFLTNGSATGYYKKAKADDKILGIALAQNVKVPHVYPAGPNYEVTTVAGETINLLVRGFVAVEAGTLTNVKEGDAVYLAAKSETDTTLVVTNVGAPDAEALENSYFTGIVETVNGVTLAEISYRM
jgi:hypothetical protein